MFLGDALDFLLKKLDPYIRQTKERLETMYQAKEARTAPARYLKMLKKISPQHSGDWRAGDVCFLEQYKNDSELYQKLLEIRENYFNDKLGL